MVAVASPFLPLIGLALKFLLGDTFPAKPNPSLPIFDVRPLQNSPCLGFVKWRFAHGYD